MHQVRRLGVVLAFALASVSSVALAGFRSSTRTVVWTGGAIGTLADARSAPGTTGYIGCTAVAYSGGSYVACAAQDAYGVYASCWSQNPQYASLVSSMTANSQLYFLVNATTGQCDYLEVQNYSYYAPVEP